MQNTSFKLVDTTYATKDAWEVLYSLVNDKIKFLNLQLLSNAERYGEEGKHLSERIQQLNHDLKEIKQALDQAEAKGLQVRINGQIDLEFVEAKTKAGSSKELVQEY